MAEKKLIVFKEPFLTKFKIEDRKEKGTGHDNRIDDSVNNEEQSMED